jgi:hypothetical protein
VTDHLHRAFKDGDALLDFTEAALDHGGHASLHQLLGEARNDRVEALQGRVAVGRLFKQKVKKAGSEAS